MALDQEVKPKFGMIPRDQLHISVLVLLAAGCPRATGDFTYQAPSCHITRRLDGTDRGAWATPQPVCPNAALCQLKLKGG